jgi:hypothetical protein
MVGMDCELLLLVLWVGDVLCVVCFIAGGELNILPYVPEGFLIQSVIKRVPSANSFIFCIKLHN